MAAKPTSVAELFKSKAKKKPKSTNLNAERPPEEPKPVLRSANPDAAGEDGWERSLRQDQDTLKACGLWLREVDADGACLFRAFADQLDGDGGEAHAAYRERCVDFMRANRDDFAPFIDEDFDTYCESMRQATTWGGQVEAKALARSTDVNLRIYQPSEARRADALEQTVVEFLVADDAARCVQLCYHPLHHHGRHYNSVRCVDDDGSGPALAVTAPELRARIQDALNPKVPEPVPEVAADEEAAKPKTRSKTSVRIF